MNAHILYRYGTSFLNHAPIIGLSVALAVGFLGLSPRPATATPFTPVIEEFQIVRDSSSFFDPFDNGTLPTIGSNYLVTGPGGMISETTVNGGRLTMNPALGVPSTGPGNADTITRALWLTSTNPLNNSTRLGPENQVQVRGLFNISLPNTLPTVNGQSFGIRLQDGGTQSNDIASLDVGRSPGGQLRIRFSDVDLLANTNQTAGTFIISSLAGAVFIELLISKDAGSVNPIASFRLLDATQTTVLSSGVLDNINDITGLPVALYNGEDFARGAFYSTNATPLPGALPLFATVLTGGGLIAWRRKRKAKAAVAA